MAQRGEGMQLGRRGGFALVRFSHPADSGGCPPLYVAVLAAWYGHSLAR